MHEDAETENERPFSLKRDRKQSRTFQGLLEKEPVTKSPFKQLERVSNLDEAPSPPPSPIPKLSLLTNLTPVATIVSRLTPVESDIPVPTSGPSPGRSSLVSKRLHGPRLSGGVKRERRKTVTFDERCDVVEFDRETSEEECWEESDDVGRYGEPFQDAEESDPFFCGDEMADDPPQSELRERPVPDVSMDDDLHESGPRSESGRSTATRTLLDLDTSITGLVEEMFFSSNAALISANSLEPSTPPRACDIPTDLETDEGVPFEQTHYAEHLQQHQQEFHKRSQPHFSPRVSPQPSHTPTHHSPRVEENNERTNVPYPFDIGLPARAPLRGSSASLPCVPAILAESTPPLNRTIQLERMGRNQEAEINQAEETEADTETLPMSSSPTKAASTPPTRSDGWIPKYKWPRGEQLPGSIGSSSAYCCAGSQHMERRSPSVGADPFEPRERSFEEHPKASNDSMDPSNLSIGHSEVSLSGLDHSETYHSSDEVCCYH
jgi:hypothetical protein